MTRAAARARRAVGPVARVGREVRLTDAVEHLAAVVEPHAHARERRADDAVAVVAGQLHGARAARRGGRVALAAGMIASCLLELGRRTEARLELERYVSGALGPAMPSWLPPSCFLCVLIVPGCLRPPHPLRGKSVHIMRAGMLPLHACLLRSEHPVYHHHKLNALH